DRAAAWHAAHARAPPARGVRDRCRSVRRADRHCRTGSRLPGHGDRSGLSPAGRTEPPDSAVVGPLRRLPPEGRRAGADLVAVPPARAAARAVPVVLPAARRGSTRPAAGLARGTRRTRLDPRPHAARRRAVRAWHSPPGDAARRLGPLLVGELLRFCVGADRTFRDRNSSLARSLAPPPPHLSR